MKIAFVTTQSLTGSTVIGRVLPLAEEFTKNHKVYVLGHFTPSSLPLTKREKQWGWISLGKDPFTKTPHGKKRLKGLALVLRLKLNAFTAALKLISLKPDVIIIVKSLPENVLAVWLTTFLVHPKKIILDVDDFELTANVTVSLLQRAGIHWAERTGTSLADHIVTATPFLSDHFEQLKQKKKPITMIPTGMHPLSSLPLTKREKQWGSLIYAGNLSLSSGHRIDLLPDILAKVRQEYPDIELHVFGTGDDETLLKQEGIILHGRFSPPFLKELGVGIIFLDPIDDTTTNRAKSSFRVALATTLGLPVVTSDIGIRPYLIPDELHARFFAKPGDAEDYAAKTAELFRHPLTQNESNSLQTHAHQFTWQTLAKKYEKIIAE